MAATLIRICICELVSVSVGICICVGWPASRKI